jgi:hypothetical protein
VAQLGIDDPADVRVIVGNDDQRTRPAGRRRFRPRCGERQRAFHRAGAGRVSALQEEPDPQHELAQIDRLAEKLVRPQRESREPVLDAFAAREEDHGDPGERRIGLELAADVKPVQFRQFDVEQNQRRPLRTHGGKHGVAGDDTDRRIARLPQADFHDGALIGVVFDDEHLHGVDWHSVSRYSGGRPDGRNRA